MLHFNILTCNIELILERGFPGGSVEKNLRAMQDMGVQCLGQEDPLEKQTATHSRILAWEIPWTEEPGGLQSMGLQRVGHDGTTRPLRSVGKSSSHFKLNSTQRTIWLRRAAGLCGRLQIQPPLPTSPLATGNFAASPIQRQSPFLQTLNLGWVAVFLGK